MAETAGQAFDELLVRAQLASGDLTDIGQGLKAVNQRLAGHVMAFLRRHFPGANPDDLADLWQETLRETFLKARDGEFDGERPLMPFLCTVARRRGIDAQRKRTPREQAVQAIGEALRDTQVGAEWRALDALTRNEILEQLRVYAETLPHKQRVVFQTFADGYPDTHETEVLRVRVSEVIGEPQTLVSVKSALQAARAKVTEFLTRKGVSAPAVRRRP